MRKLILLVLLASTCWATAPVGVATCPQTTASSGVACSATTTAGYAVYVGISWRTDTVSIMKIVGSATNSFFVIYAQAPYHCNGTGTCSALAVCLNCAALTSVTPTFSATTKYVINIAQSSTTYTMGITGVATNSNTAPGVTLTTNEANDCLLVETASAGAANPSSNSGSLLETNNAGSSGVAGGLVVNCPASAGSVTSSVTVASGIWSASGVELRTAYAKTYIWPDCDSTHPCLIHHKSTQALNSSDTLTTPLYIHVNPSLANNLLVLTIPHPSGSTISSIADNNGQAWSSGASATDATDATMVDVRYVCGAAAGTATIGITLSGTIAANVLFGVEYNEYSGVAASSCQRANSDNGGVNTTVIGNLQPGSMTVVAGDLITAYTIDASAAQGTYASGWFMPDDLSVLIWDDMYANAASSQSIASGTSANPTLYVNSPSTLSDAGDTRYFIIGEAFKASSGAGTQPPAGSWVVRDVMYRNVNPGAAFLPITAFPTNGNALVLTSSVFESQNDLTHVTDNQGSTFEVNTVTDSSGDAQQLIACLGSGGGVVRDRAIAGMASDAGSNSEPLEMYDIAGAKQSTGSGCIGTMKNHGVGTVASGSCTGALTGQCANTVSNSSQFSPHFTFAPTLNGTANSVVFITSAITQGPPAAACDTGGQTPPTCNNTMGLTAATSGNILGAASATSGFVFSSIWAAGMTDTSHYSNGDEYGYFYTASTTAQSMDFWLANSSSSSGTGATNVNIAGVEILGQPAATSAIHHKVIGQ